MRYTKPTVLAAMSASVAIQNGTGATSRNQAKMSHLRDFIAQNPPVSLSTTGAYEADE